MGWLGRSSFTASTALLLFLSGCGGPDQNALNGYWIVSEVQTQGLGTGGHREQSWEVTEGAAYVIGFQNNRMSIPTYGAGLQEFQLPQGGASYQLDGERISMGNSMSPLEIKDLSKDSLTLSQTVMAPNQGNEEVVQKFHRIDPYHLQTILSGRNEPIPPELQGSMGGQGMTPGQAGPQGSGMGPSRGGYPSQNPVPNQQQPGMTPPQVTGPLTQGANPGAQGAIPNQGMVPPVQQNPSWNGQQRPLPPGGNPQPGLQGPGYNPGFSSGGFQQGSIPPPQQRGGFPPPNNGSYGGEGNPNFGNYNPSTFQGSGNGTQGAPPAPAP